MYAAVAEHDSNDERNIIEETTVVDDPPPVYYPSTAHCIPYEIVKISDFEETTSSCMR